MVNGGDKARTDGRTIEGLSVDEFIARNADPILLHENGMWECIKVELDEAWVEEPF